MSLVAFSKAVLAGTAGGAAYLGYTKWQVRKHIVQNTSFRMVENADKLNKSKSLSLFLS